MAAPKGQPKSGGRQKGTPNKVTKDVRDFVRELISNNLELIEKDFKKISPKERLQLTVGLLQYVIPKMTETSLESNLDGITLNFHKAPLTPQDIEEIKEIQAGDGKSIPISSWANPNCKININ
jgi:hypothetical protein